MRLISPSYIKQLQIQEYIFELNKDKEMAVDILSAATINSLQILYFFKVSMFQMLKCILFQFCYLY